MVIQYLETTQVEEFNLLIKQMEVILNVVISKNVDLLFMYSYIEMFLH